MKRAQSPILEALRIAANDDAEALRFLEARRWGDAPACPLCGDLDVYQMADAKTGERNKDGRWRCRGCKRMYTVRTGTVMAESRLPLRVWCYAFWKACSSKKGVSAKQIERECEISYKSALFVMHRIRAGVADLNPPKLSGTVEADETYVGGKPRNRRKGMQGQHDKTPVIGAVERGGEIRFRVMERVTAAGLKAALREHVEQDARLHTDESSAYTKLGREYGGGHHTVNHSKREYARGEVHTNTIEGAFSLIKRGMYGTFHSVSKKHLHRYMSEFEFRYNTRKLDDGQRVAAEIKRSEGKRLTYAEQVSQPGA
ncbi:MAG: IS1595 family transposase [Planctomycetes bacterium]|nr:IS1595 family transposase [Planctomycetota bacterium]MCB9903640.1 IS1595 family transposase [Planctomycetota bacterium]